MSIILSVIIGFAATAIGFLVGYKTGYGDALRIVADGRIPKVWWKSLTTNGENNEY